MMARKRNLTEIAMKYALLLVSLLATAASAQVDPALFSGMSWRNIGPFRAGRVAAVSGVIGQPGTYYMGLPLGGVWKTTSAGTTWTPIMDSVKTASSVGAIEVAPSNPNVIYVGMGDLITGGGINEGDGVYKSVDAGKTWTHLGLDETKQIPSILVDPNDPNLVMIAAQGNVHKKSDQRGVYRSVDGGKTWTKTLYVDDETGIQKIAWAFDNPKVMLATTVRHYNAPGGGGRGFGGGGERNSGTKLFKSLDEGISWTEIESKTLPPLSGRTCVAIACGTGSQRMFLVQNSGLWRSDDGGASWRQMDKDDRRVRNGQGGYNCGVYVDPHDPNTVYVVNTCSYVSRDGGETFTGFKGAPGGDDPQQMWIDPTDGKRIFLGMDQGATVTFDGGLHWSLWYNQRTGQFYHIAADNQFPYWVYGTEQDSGSIATASRGAYGAITMLDWTPHPGYEFGSITADPLDPRISYAGSAGGGIVKVTRPSKQWINVSPNVDSAQGLRKVTNQPLLWNPRNPHELLTGFQYVMATTDGGLHWKKLSPDLTLAKGEKAPAPSQTRPARTGGGNTEEGWKDEDEEESEQFGRGGGAIESMSLSSVDGRTMWVGTNNGLIHVSRDHGATWEDATIPGLPARADISAVDASHHVVGEAYAAVDCHNGADMTPYFYRTRDFGKTWTKIVAGLPTDLPSGSFARVIRADTQAKGLLFAGTESYMYVSFDDGDHWQSLALNLPNTSYRDALIKGDDLVVGTYGRAFWILDDLSPLRDIARSAELKTRLYPPAEATRVRRNVNQDTPFPPEVPHALNPPICALDYYLADAPKGEITIDVKDSSGRPVRHFSSAPVAESEEAAPPIPDFWVAPVQPLSTQPGMHRVDWNLRYDDPPAFSHSYEINANPGQTPASPEGPLVLPGEYTVTLTVDGQTWTQKLTVRNDPRSPASARELRAQHALEMEAYEGAQQAWASYHEIQTMRDAVAELQKPAEGPNAVADEVSTALKAFDDKLAALQGAGGGFRFGGGFPGRGGPQSPSFAGLQGSMIRNLDRVGSGDAALPAAMIQACRTTQKEFDEANAKWRDLNAKDLPILNALLAKHNLKPIAAQVVAESRG